MRFKWLPILLLLLLTIPVASCEKGERKASPTVAFRVESLNVPEGDVKKVRGQVLYMPIYSNLPYMEKKRYDVSAFLAVHNTDLKNQIKITNVAYLNTDGMVVKQFLAKPRQLAPLATEIFTVSQEDQSGTGANFIIEWISDLPVNEPLIESVMTNLTGTTGLSFLSHGRVMRELK